MTFTVEIKARPGKNNELYQTLQSLLLTMCREEGCLDARVSRDSEDGCIYVLSSEWNRQESLDMYLKSGSGSALIGAMDLLGASSRIRMGGDLEWEPGDTLKQNRKEP